MDSSEIYQNVVRYWTMNVWDNCILRQNNIYDGDMQLLSLTELIKYFGQTECVAAGCQANVLGNYYCCYFQRELR